LVFYFFPIYIESIFYLLHALFYGFDGFSRFEASGYQPDRIKRVIPQIGVGLMIVKINREFF